MLSCDVFQLPLHSAQAHMCQGLGQHVRAVELLTQALKHCTSRDATIECLFLRGAD